MDKELNAHAFVAWLYLRECAKCCPDEASMDYEFVCLVRDLRDWYPDEFELLIGEDE